jgi:hypothetical protein
MFSDYSTCPTTLPCRSVCLDTLVTLSGTRPYRLRAWCKAVKSQPHFPRILAVRLLLSPVHQGMNIPSVLWGCAKFERPQRGIGAAIALDLGRRGANVVINYSTDKSKTAAEAVVLAIRESNPEASTVAVQTNISSSHGRQKLVDAAIAAGAGRNIDILVHNAGNGDDRYLEDLDEDFFDMQIGLNVKGNTKCNRYSRRRTDLCTKLQHRLF